MPANNNDAPKLKDPNEIFASLSRNKTSIGAEQDGGDFPMPGEGKSAPRHRGRHTRVGAIPMPDDAMENTAPLNVGKYELPKSRRAKPVVMPDVADEDEAATAFLEPEKKRHTRQTTRERASASETVTSPETPAKIQEAARQLEEETLSILRQARELEEQAQPPSRIEEPQPHIRGYEFEELEPMPPAAAQPIQPPSRSEESQPHIRGYEYEELEPFPSDASQVKSTAPEQDSAPRVEADAFRTQNQSEAQPRSSFSSAWEAAAPPSPPEWAPPPPPMKTEDPRANMQAPLPWWEGVSAKGDSTKKNAERSRSTISNTQAEDEYFRRISSDFEREFTNKFSDRGSSRRNETDGSKNARSEMERPRTAPQAEKVAPPFSDLDIEESRAASSFVERFSSEVRMEENGRAESFKDTLSEKFMRERERYLRDLGIADRVEQDRAEEESRGKAENKQRSVEPTRRRLDFQIQPEMHMSDGEAPKPVTYSRAGEIRAMEESTDAKSVYIPVPDLPTTMNPPPATGGKKSSEQLLRELADQVNAAQSRIETETPSRRSSRKAAVAAASIAASATPKEKEPEKKRFKLPPARVIALVASAAVAAVALIAWPVITWRMETGGQIVNAPSSASSSIAEDAFTVYESRDFEGQSYDDVLVKRSNISLKNLNVGQYLLIEEVESQGALTLENVRVDGSIYLSGCAVTELDLRGVKAARVIVNNSKNPVKVKASGDTDIGTVEVRTPVTISQEPLLGAQPIGGITNIIAVSEDSAQALALDLQGVSLQSFDVTGESVVKLNGATVENMAAQGSISVNGSGKIVNLAVSAQADSPFSVLIKDVVVSNLNVKSAGNFNISTAVDTMAVEYNANIGGSGTIGSLSVNGKASGSRLILDIVGPAIQTLTTNAETRVNSTGSSRVDMLVANASTYATGNKIGQIRVNADNVVYEKEPDRIMVASGVHPPQPASNNPNMDFTQTASQASSRPVDLSADTIATTCGHARENGGFIVGDGSKDNPFEVSTPLQLEHVSAHAASHFLQTGNIDMADESRFAGGFTMICADGSPFSGSYNGAGYNISNLRIMSDKQSVGLFAENTGLIENIVIYSGEISSTTSKDAFVGGIAGMNYQGGIIQACANGAKIVGGASTYSGGIAGYNYGGKIKDCYNAAKVTGKANVGGVAGVNSDGASVSGSYNVGTISGELRVGAVAGVNEKAVITNCYYLLDTAAAGIGEGSGTAIEKSSDEMRSEQIVADLAAGNDASKWSRGAQGNSSYNYPVLRYER